MFLKKKIYILPFAVIIILFSFNTLADFRESDKKLKKEFKEINKEVNIDFVDYEGKQLRYYSPNPIDNTQPSILFIHGAPGTGSSYFNYLKDADLMAKANLISLDRLGYGYSDFGNAETSIQKQAESIYAIIKKHELNNIILFGWSYGVPIVGKMAYLYPEIKHSILLSGAVSPDDEKFFGIGKIAHWKATRWIAPKAFRVANEEKHTHINELLKMQNNWSQIKSPITYYHGTKDWIVPYKNMIFMKNSVNDSLLKSITVEGAGHFILFKLFDEIKLALLDILSEKS